MADSIESQIIEIQQRLQSFESSLPRRIDPIALSRSRLPFKALSYRETLIWRVTELGLAAQAAFIAEKYAVAILLTRAVVETTAALWYLENKVKAALDQGALADLDNYLMRLHVGTRTWEDFPAAISVLTFVDCVDKTLEGFRHQYDMLSEFAHPNYSGTTGLYSKSDAENILVDFGSNVRKSEAPRSIGITNLSVALMMFEHTYNKLGDAMPEFVILCENSLDTAT